MGGSMDRCCCSKRKRALVNFIPYFHVHLQFHVNMDAVKKVCWISCSTVTGQMFAPPPHLAVSIQLSFLFYFIFAVAYLVILGFNQMWSGALVDWEVKCWCSFYVSTNAGFCGLLQEHLIIYSAIQTYLKIKFLQIIKVVRATLE